MIITAVQYPPRSPQSGRLRRVPKTPIVSAAASLCFVVAFGRTLDSNGDMSSPSSSLIPDFPKPSRYPNLRWIGLDRIVKLFVDGEDVAVNDDDCEWTNFGVATAQTTRRNLAPRQHNCSLMTPATISRVRWTIDCFEFDATSKVCIEKWWKSCT